MARSVGRGTTGRRGHAYTQHGTLRGRIGIARFAFGRGAAAPAVRAPAPLRVGRDGVFLSVRQPITNLPCVRPRPRARRRPRALCRRASVVSLSLSSRCPCRSPLAALRDTCLRRGPARGAVSLGCREARSTVDAIARRSTSSRAGRRGRPPAPPPAGSGAWRSRRRQAGRAGRSARGRQSRPKLKDSC